MRTTVGKRIAVVDESDATAVVVTGADPIDTTPFVGAIVDVASIVRSLVDKLSPITSACEEDDADTCSSFVVDDKC